VNAQEVITYVLPVDDTPVLSRVLEDDPLLPEEPGKIKRIATLDFFRGFSIFFMIFFHVFMKLYDYSYIKFDEAPVVPIPVLVLMGLAAFFGTWHAFFMFISCIVNSYVVTKKAQKLFRYLD